MNFLTPMPSRHWPAGGARVAAAAQGHRDTPLWSAASAEGDHRDPLWRGTHQGLLLCSSTV